MLLALALAGCSSSSGPTVTSAAAGLPVVLTDPTVPFAEIEVPPDSRDGEPAPEAMPVAGDWVLVQGTDDVRKYQAPLPVRPRALFFMHPPQGMEVVDHRGNPVTFGGGRSAWWSFDESTLTATVPMDSGPPTGWQVRYPFATDREKALNYALSGAKSPGEFARTSVQVRGRSMSGVLLPAPAHAAWDVQIPPAGALWFSPGIVPPEAFDGLPSDGAEARVEVDAGGSTTVAWRGELAEGVFDEQRVDLSRWAGQSVRVRLVTEPGATSRFDYAFFGDPTIASRKSDPKRVVLVFVDTLRRDHVGLYGYSRDTTAPLDAWAKDAVVFDDARSVAPWTLPSARSILTGREPELWDSAETLQGHLRAEGWATAEFASNVYLSSNFGMNRDFGVHEVQRAVPAATEVDRALDWLDDNDGRDALVVVHFMDCHLPYAEPAAYRWRYVSPTSPGNTSLPESFERGPLARVKTPTPEIKQYVIDRYDQSVAYIHDEVGRLFANLEPNDVVVYFSDHGEEFWDHNGIEHGHTLYDELLRVPLVIKAPGLKPGRLAEPVTLLDVVPTVLDLLGEKPLATDGTSLVAAMNGDEPAKKALAGRDIAFGRPLYGSERWGVLHGTDKYMTTEGRESLYHLDADPSEKKDELAGKIDADAAPWRAILAGALGRPVALGYRIWPTRSTGAPNQDLVAQVDVPGGIARAWVGEDPTDQSAANVTIDGETLSAKWLRGFKGSREVFFVPNAPVADTTHALTLRTTGADGNLVSRQVDPVRDVVPGAMRAPLLRGNVPGGRMLALGFDVTVAPAEGAEAINGADVEMKAALESLGYTFDDRAGTERSDGSDRREPAP